MNVLPGQTWPPVSESARLARRYGETRRQERQHRVADRGVLVIFARHIRRMSVRTGKSRARIDVTDRHIPVLANGPVTQLSEDLVERLDGLWRQSGNRNRHAPAQRSGTDPVGEPDLGIRRTHPVVTDRQTCLSDTGYRRRADERKYRACYGRWISD
jgi:hypothetical protein